MSAIYEVETYRPSKSVGHLVNRLRSEMLTALDSELAKDPDTAALDVSSAQYIILTNLADDESNSTTRFCKHMSYDPGAMTRMVDRLEAKGLVSRRRCEQDRRRSYLELTEEGRTAIPKLRACSVRVLNHFLRGFTPDEVMMLERLLTRMIRNA